MIKISGMTTKNWLILIFLEAAINSINHGYCLPKYLIFSDNFSFFEEKKKGEETCQLKYHFVKLVLQSVNEAELFFE